MIFSPALISFEKGRKSQEFPRMWEAVGESMPMQAIGKSMLMQADVLDLKNQSLGSLVCPF